jgi:hypothetical protein
MSIGKTFFSHCQRHYTTLHPVSNKILAMKWDKTTHTNHIDKVASMRPGIDNSSPKNHLHLQKKLKKLQLEKERLAEIRRNNEILHERVQVLTRMKGKQAQTQQQNRDRYLKAANMSHMQARTRENQRIQAQNEVIVFKD